MSGRMYWLSVVAVLGVSFAVWFGVASLLGVADPAPGAAVMSVISMTCYLGLLGWILKSTGENIASPTE